MAGISRTKARTAILLIAVALFAGIVTTAPTISAEDEGCWRVSLSTGEVYYDPECDPNNPDPIQL